MPHILYHAAPPSSCCVSPITLFDLQVNPPAPWDEQRERVGL